jgi:hypothetical protein
MIWHILNKDLKLLWRATLAVAAINVIQRVMLSSAELLGESNLLELANIFGYIALAATAVLIVSVVHQDPLPVVRQDWLVRPINRGQLLTSKLLYVALSVQGPILLAEIGQGLMAGLPFWLALATATSRSAWMLLAMDLPCMALATLTRNMTQAVGSALAVAVGFVLIFGLSLVFGYRGGPGIRLSTIAWVAESAQTLWGAAAAATVLTLQYGWRKTIRARWAFGVAALVWTLVEAVPVGSAFAIQERLSRDSSAAGAVDIAFAPALGLAGRAPNPQSEIVRMGIPERVAFLSIPLRFGGFTDGSWLLADEANIHFADSAGKRIELDATARVSDFREATGYELFNIPETAYNPIKDQALQVEIDYSLSLMQADSAQTVPVVEGNQWISGLGRCTTRTDPAGEQVDLNCVAPHPLPCSSWFLENAQTGRQGPRAIPHVTNWGFHGPVCWPDFSPYTAGMGGDPAYRFDLHFALSGVVDRGRLKDARLRALVDRPVAHFRRRVIIPNIRLSDWRLQ